MENQMKLDFSLIIPIILSAVVLNIVTMVVFVVILAM